MIRRTNFRNANRSGIYDSNCGETRLRGTAHQIRDKYLVLASETEDKVLAERYHQHAEHYTRVIGDEIAV